MYVTGIKFRLENGWNSKQMITEGEAAIPLETTRRAFGNQEKSKQRSAIVYMDAIFVVYDYNLFSLNDNYVL